MAITKTLDVNAALIQSSFHKAKAKYTEDALKDFSGWQNDKDHFRLENALKVIAETDTIAQQVAPELVDLINNYSLREIIERCQRQGDNHNASYYKREESQTKILAIKAVLFSPDTPGLKKALLTLFKDKSDETSELRLEVVKAFNTVKIDEDVINMLTSALSTDKELDVRLESVKLLKREKVNSNEIIDIFSNHLGIKNSEKKVEIVMVEALAQMGAKALRAVPVLANELEETQRMISSDAYPSKPYGYRDVLKRAIKDICKAADLQLQKT